VNTTTPFAWSTSPDAQAYYLTVGSTQGNDDVVNSGILPTSQTSYQVGTLPSGETLYGRVWTEINGSWSYYQDITFTVSGMVATDAHAHARTHDARAIPHWLRAVMRHQQRSTPRWLRTIRHHQRLSTPRWLRITVGHQQRSTPKGMRTRR
jgi:hypothetical protein